MQINEVDTVFGNMTPLRFIG